jgi:uroporphyrinogen III methyltransferase/synthase
MRIVVTRAVAQARPLADRLAALGHQVVLCPLLEIEPLGDEPLDVSAYDWVVVTSPNGAGELARRRAGEPRRLAAVGPGTAEALRAQGLEPDVVADDSRQEGLLAVLPDDPGRVLVAAAEGARRLLAAELAADFIPLYRTRERVPAEAPEGDLAVLASPSAARAFGRLAAPMPVVSIGPETTRAARRAGLEVLREAEPHTLDGLVRAVASLPPCSSRS